MGRVEGMAKARAVKTERVKGRIQTAINILRLYGKKITVRSVADEAGVSTTSAQKYLSQNK
jgi:DNA-binding GntR family transcriptional regulator